MSRLEGIVTPMVTPLKRDYSLDIAGVENLVEYLIKGGVSALFPLGTTGGGPMLPSEMQQEVCSAVCRFSNGRLPVLIGISAAAPADYVKMACYAADHGANGVVAAPPCYIPLDAPLGHSFVEVPSENGQYSGLLCVNCEEFRALPSTIRSERPNLLRILTEITPRFTLPQALRFSFCPATISVRQTRERFPSLLTAALG